MSTVTDYEPGTGFCRRCLHTLWSADEVAEERAVPVGDLRRRFRRGRDRRRVAWHEYLCWRCVAEDTDLAHEWAGRLLGERREERVR